MDRNHAPLRLKKDVTRAIQLKLHERMKKKRKSKFQVIVTLCGRNKNLEIISSAIALLLLKTFASENERVRNDVTRTNAFTEREKEFSALLHFQPM